VKDASFKKELTRDEMFATREEARASIFEYVEVLYNHVSYCHTSLCA
jgi:putative transposase